MQTSIQRIRVPADNSSLYPHRMSLLLLNIRQTSFRLAHFKITVKFFPINLLIYLLFTIEKIHSFVAILR